jgi:putative ABC transport system permease protein
MDRPLVDMRQVNPDYFRTMGIPLRAGRLFEDHDGDHLVAVISALTAARVWPGVNPVGRRFRMGDGSGPAFEVVGVVGDIRGVSLNKAPTATLYVPYWQRSNSQISLVVRTAAAGKAIGPEIHAAIRRLDAEMPVPTLRTMDELVSDSLSQRRFQMALVLLFAAGALLLASLGIYGVVSYSVGQRTGEMGIRMALGAAPGRIRMMVLRQALIPTVAGLAAGIAASLGLGRVLEAMLFGVTGGDPVTVGTVAAVLTAVAATASYIPARRATRVDPAVALRVE